ncbi:UbiA family prenyltransferase [soil metagenome]
MTRAPALPLVVDLDGTLLAGDMLLETANEYVAGGPWRAIALVARLGGGRARTKEFLAERTVPDVAVLPYREDVLQYVRNERATGRRTILATATSLVIAERIADHLGLFDEVLGSTAGSNLKGPAKADLLVRTLGRGGFVYVGDSAADLAVWRVAAGAVVVSSRPRFVERVRAVTSVEAVIPKPVPRPVRSLLAAVRPHQWTKNLLVVIPLLASHRFDLPLDLARAGVAFVLFSLVASAVYVLNDLMDIPQDRHHSRKRGRPFASGALPLWAGWLLWPALLVVAAAVALLLLPPAFLLALAGYFVLTLGYSLVLKRRAMWDVLALAVLYLARLIAGAVAIGVEVSFWLLCFAMFFFLSLALVKRYNELREDRSLPESPGGPAKIRGRGYFVTDLPLVESMGPAAGYVSALIVALYVYDGSTASMYATPEFLWITVPLLLFWISRVWLIAHRGEMHDDPVVFAIQDRTSYLVGALVVLGVLLATFVTAG